MSQEKFARPASLRGAFRQGNLPSPKRTKQLRLVAEKSISSGSPAELTAHKAALLSQREQIPPPKPSADAELSAADKKTLPETRVLKADLLSRRDRMPRPRPSTDGEPSIFDWISLPALPKREHSPTPPDGIVLGSKSAVASWTLDIVDLLDGYYTQARAPLASHVDSNECRKWLQECVNDHDHPETVAGISTPLQQLPLSTCLRAIQTSTGQLSALDPREEFVALTYTWGKTSMSSAAQLAKLMDAARKVSAGLPSFPPTIRDAIVLARDLGFKWLWVDRICIDQTDEAEKALLIPYMKDIFAAAQLTIVASSGSGANRGLPGIGATERHPEKPFVLPQQSGRDLKVLTTPMSFNAMLQESTWRTRGWCFEEHVFSRRLLYVFPSEVFFSCAKGTFRESEGRNLSDDVAGSTWGDNSIDCAYV